MGIRQNQLISRLENFIRTRIGITQTWVKARLVDREFTVRKGAWYCANKEELTDPEQIAHRGRCHLLLQPGAWEYPDWLRNISQSAPLSQALT